MPALGEQVNIPRIWQASSATINMSGSFRPRSTVPSTRAHGFFRAAGCWLDSTGVQKDQRHGRAHHTLGGSIQALSDNYVTMRYRSTHAAHPAVNQWSGATIG